MRAGKNRQANDLNIFLQRRAHNHLRSLPQPGVNHFHAGIAQGARNHFGAAIVPVEPRFGHQHANLEVSHSIHLNTGAISQHRASSLAVTKVFLYPGSSTDTSTQRCDKAPSVSRSSPSVADWAA